KMGAVVLGLGEERTTRNRRGDFDGDGPVSRDALEPAPLVVFLLGCGAANSAFHLFHQPVVCRSDVQHVSSFGGKTSGARGGDGKSSAANWAQYSDRPHVSDGREQEDERRERVRHGIWGVKTHRRMGHDSAETDD